MSRAAREERSAERSVGTAIVVKPASWRRDEVRATRLLHVDPHQDTLADLRIGALPSLLRPGDVVVVNDAATLPASLRGATETGQPIELRLAGQNADGAWRAVLFGAGDWRTRTEDRPPPPPVAAGTRLLFDGITATVVEVDRALPRLLDVLFDKTESAFWRALYRAGRPVQYAHTARALPLWLVQTAYAARPWAVEAPSAGFALDWELLAGLRKNGIRLARVTHAAGISSTGDAALDARLPFRERYDISIEAAHAIAEAKRAGGRVLAVGTTVARALEGAQRDGVVDAGAGETELLLGPDTRRRIVDGLVTGVHDTDTSHFRLLEAFAPRPLLERAHAFAAAADYRSHEFGDAVVIWSTETGQ